MTAARSFSKVVLAVLAGVLVSGCLMRLEEPELEVGIEGAYNSDDITVPFRVLGLPPGSILAWELLEFNGSDYVFRGGQSVRVQTDDSGLIQLGELGEGRYQLIIETISSRGDIQTVIPSLSQAQFFFVDRTPPNNIAPAQFAPPPGNHPASMELGVAVDYDPTNSLHPTYDPGLRSPQRVLVVVGAVRPPITGVDEIQDSRFRVWNANEYTPTDSITVTWVVVDQAGNRSVLDTGVYNAQ